MITTKEIYTLSLIPNLGSKTLLRIIRANISLESLAKQSEKSIGIIFKGANAASILNTLKNNLAEFTLKAEYNIEQFKEKGVGLISIVDNQYPQQLKYINHPPPLLFYRGNLSLLANFNAIAIVGMRNCSDIGRNIATEVSTYFASNDYVVVSGLALGIDTSAHLGSLIKHQKAIAVVVDVTEIVPKENIKLANLIIENGGLLVAENAPHTQIYKGAFVDRNRIQTGLSLATFVIESELNGGSMHTAEFAHTQNRLIYCPDISNLNNQANGLSTAGLAFLIKTGKAINFNKTNFSSVINSIQAKKREFEIKKQAIDNLGKPNNPNGTVLTFDF